MNPFRWKHEHQLAWGLICLIGAILGVLFAWFQSPFYQISHSSLSGEWSNQTQVFLSWIPYIGLYWPWPLFGAIIPGLAFYVFQLLKVSPRPDRRPTNDSEVIGAKEAESLGAEFEDFERLKSPIWSIWYITTPMEIIGGATRPFFKLWKGQYTLPVAFWFFLLIGTILAPLVAAMIYAPFYLFGMPQVLGPLSVFATVVYPAFAAVGVWRSANARSFRRWPVAAALAKIGVCLWLLGIASRVTGMGFMDVVRLAGLH